MSNLPLPITPASASQPPLRVLLVCEDIPGVALGGLARHVVALGNALIDAGHAVTLMGRIAPQLDGRAEPSGFRGPFVAGFADPVRGWKEQPTGAFNPWKRPWLARQIARAIVARAADFDVVHYHGHLPMVGRYVPAGIRFLQTRHDQGSECVTHTRFRAGEVCTATDPRACAGCIHPAPGPLRTAISAAAVRRYRREATEAFTQHPVIFVSQFLHDNFCRTVPDAPAIQAHTVHNFVDEGALKRTADAEQVGKERFVLFLAGRMDAPKGIAAFVDLIAARMPQHWVVHVFGDGPQRAELAARHASSRVQLFGHVSAQRVIEAAAGASVWVVPSVWEEAFGLVTLEALRLGKPCYALRRGGTPELARYGAPGQLRLFADLPALADGVLAGAEPARDSSVGESADVRVRLPQLLALYRAQGAPQ